MQEEVFARLRELLSQEPSSMWLAAIGDALQKWPEDEDFSICVEYVKGHTALPAALNERSGWSYGDLHIVGRLPRYAIAKRPHDLYLAVDKNGREVAVECSQRAADGHPFWHSHEDYLIDLAAAPHQSQILCTFGPSTEKSHSLIYDLHDTLCLAPQVALWRQLPLEERIVLAAAIGAQLARGIYQFDRATFHVDMGHIVYQLHPGTTFIRKNGQIAHLPHFWDEVDGGVPDARHWQALYRTPREQNGRSISRKDAFFKWGLVLYELLAGSHPFYREEWYDIHTAMEQAPPPLSEEVSFPLRRLVMQLLGHQGSIDEEDDVEGIETLCLNELYQRGRETPQAVLAEKTKVPLECLKLLQRLSLHVPPSIADELFCAGLERMRWIPLEPGTGPTDHDLFSLPEFPSTRHPRNVYDPFTIVNPAPPLSFFNPAPNENPLSEEVTPEVEPFPSWRSEPPTKEENRRMLGRISEMFRRFMGKDKK